MAEVQSLAAYLQGRLSLKDFEWPQSLRPSLPSTTQYLHSHLIPEIDLQVLLNREGKECKSAEPYGSHGPILESSAGSCAREYTRLLHAATTCGFFQVLNHSVPIHALETLYSYACRFFSMPLEHKLEVAEKVGNFMAGNYSSGYMCGSPLDCPKKYWCEALRTASFSKSNISAVARCLWSQEVDQQAFGDALEACSEGFKKLAAQLALLLLQDLIDDDDAEEVLRACLSTESAQGVKLSHYPACPQPDKTLGLPAHTDVGLITVLWQDDVGGLQVHLDGQWINVKPRRNALVVNIGDILQVWSNDWYKSGVHQVVLNTTQSRYSIGYFHNPSGDTMVAPLPQVLKRTGQPPKFKSIQTSEYRRNVFTQAFTAASTKDEWQGVGTLRCEEDNADLE